jgi:hypothetical protein
VTGLVHHALGGDVLGFGEGLATEHSIDNVPAQNLECMGNGSPHVRRLHDDFDLSDMVIAPPSRNPLDRNEGTSERTLDNPHVANFVDVMFEHGVWLENFVFVHGCYYPLPHKARGQLNTTVRFRTVELGRYRKKSSCVARQPLRVRRNADDAMSHGLAA